MEYHTLKWSPEVLADEIQLTNEIIVELESILEGTPAKWGIVGIARFDEPHLDKNPSEWILGLVSDIKLESAESLMKEILKYFPAFVRQDNLTFDGDADSLVQIYLRLPHQITINTGKKDDYVMDTDASKQRSFPLLAKHVQQVHCCYR